LRALLSMSEPQPEPPAAEPPARRGGAASVASGILLSRILGILRESTLAHYFGVGPHADAFTAALRAPNALQNLLGEGSLSAAFIPIYSRLLSEGREEEAGRFAGAVFGLLLAAASTIALLGVLLARPRRASCATRPEWPPESCRSTGTPCASTPCASCSR
jgi:putative peptidoglycan lipid II flippase